MTATRAHAVDATPASRLRLVLGALLLLLLATATAAPALGQRVEMREADAEARDGEGDAGAAGEGDAAPARGLGQAELEQVEQQIVKLTNEFRAREGRETVKPNEHLAAAAEYFAGYMARTGRYGHTADGQQPSQRAEKHGYEFCMVSENIAYQYNSAGFEADALAKAFTQGWIDSPGHRRNMLEEAVVDTGVAVARSEDGRYFAVQMFGRPKSMQVEFKVSNKSGETVRYTLGGQTFTLPPRVIRTHQRCRRPELRFDWPEGKEPAGAAAAAAEAVRVEGGAHYVVKAGESGRLALQVGQ